MSRECFQFNTYRALLFLPFVLPSCCSQASLNSRITTEDSSSCIPSCGNVSIQFPFRIQEDPLKCGTKLYELSCKENIAVLSLYSGEYYVQDINYSNFTIRVVDTGVHNITDHYFTNPLYSLTSFDFTDGDPYAITSPYVTIISLNCTNPMKSPLFVETAPCTGKNTYSSNNSSSSSSRNMYSYFFLHNSSWNVGDSRFTSEQMLDSRMGEEDGSTRKEQQHRLYEIRIESEIGS